MTLGSFQAVLHEQGLLQDRDVLSTYCLLWQNRESLSCLKSVLHWRPPMSSGMPLNLLIPVVTPQ